MSCLKNLLLLLLLLSTCQKKVVGQNARGDSKKVLIVYLSRTNNTKAVAEMIQGQVGGHLVEIELQNPYPENYRATVEQVQRENESGYLPPLKTKISNLAEYDTIFIGFPTWGMRIPPPMKTFLTENNLSGKTVIPFNTNAGYGVGSGFETVNQLCSNATVLTGFSVKGGIERDGVLFVMEGGKARDVNEQLEVWLKEIKVLKTK